MLLKELDEAARSDIENYTFIDGNTH